MHKDSWSERDRVRLARLLKEPLLAPGVRPKSPKRKKLWRSWIEGNLKRARRISGQWRNTRSAEALRRHFAAHWRAWSAGAVAMAVCLVVLGAVVKLESRSGEASIQLQALDRQGQLQIRWDAGSDLVRRATGAKLFIVDGAQRIYVKLDGSRLRRGAVSYPRRSDRVELRMALAEPDGRMVEQQATFVVNQPANHDPSQGVAAVKPGLAPSPSASLPSPASAAQSGEAVKPEPVPD